MQELLKCSLFWKPSIRTCVCVCVHPTAHAQNYMVGFHLGGGGHSPPCQNVAPPWKLGCPKNLIPTLYVTPLKVVSLVARQQLRLGTRLTLKLAWLCTSSAGNLISYIRGGCACTLRLQLVSLISIAALRNLALSMALSIKIFPLF